jgi:hypothetical protein
MFSAVAILVKAWMVERIGTSSWAPSEESGKFNDGGDAKDELDGDVVIDGIGVGRLQKSRS